MKTKQTYKRNGLFFAGIILLAIAILSTFVIPYFFLITPVFLLIATVLIWFSDRATSSKILWTVSPIALLGLLIVIYYQSEKMESETYLIPDNFRGYFVIWFEESCGSEAKYENGRRIYKIPEDGILITQFTREPGIIDDEFYLIDTQNNKTPLPKLDGRDFNFNGRLTKTDNEPPRDKLAAFHSNFNTVLGKTRTYTVATYQESIDIFNDKYVDSFRDKAEQKLKECRSK